MTKQGRGRAFVEVPTILFLVLTGSLAQESNPRSNSKPSAPASDSNEPGRNSQAALPSSAANSQSSQSGGNGNPNAPSATPSHPRAPDPELTAIFRAEREGSVDAEKLLNTAIKKAETTPGLEKRLSLLLEHLANVKMRQGNHEEAVAAAERALAISKAIEGPDSLNVARQLNNLAMFRPRTPDGAEDPKVEQEYQEALRIARLNPGQRSNVFLMVVNNIAQYYLGHGRAADAEALINEALQNCQGGPAPKPLQCASFRNLLAQAYRQEGHPNAAEGLAFDAVAQDASSNQSWRDKLSNLEALARQYEEDGSYDLAEANYRQALALVEANTKLDEPTMLPFVLDMLGAVLEKEGQNNEAEGFFKRALEIKEREMLTSPPRLTGYIDVHPLEGLYRAEGRLAEFEPIIKQVIEVYERVQGSEREPLADAILTLARVYRDEGRYSDAEPLCERALQIQEADYGPDSPRLAGTLYECSEIARQLGEMDKTSALEHRLKKLQEKNTPQE